MQAFGTGKAARWPLMAAAFGLMIGLAGPAFSQGAVVARFGEWQKRCETPPGAKAEQCTLIQNIAAEDKPGVTLAVVFLKTADGKGALLRALAPLNVLLPAGLGLKIDEADVGRASFLNCSVDGCLAQVEIDATLLGQLRNGKTATFIIFLSPEEGVGIPVSLAGFGQGFDSLP